MVLLPRKQTAGARCRLLLARESLRPQKRAGRKPKQLANLDFDLFETSRSNYFFCDLRGHRHCRIHTYLLAERGVMFIEQMMLEELARDRVYEFAFFAASLKLRGASGSPLRPIALPVRE